MAAGGVAPGSGGLALFYRLEDGRYILAVVKVVGERAFFASMYPTGRRVRGSHRKFRRLL